jgi:hypothetical protein
MHELDLTRVPEDRHCYAIDGIGTLRLDGIWSRSATAEAGQRSWRVSRTGFWKKAVEATDAAGSLVGVFKAWGKRRGGSLQWGGHELALRPASAWRQRYALADGDRELAVLDGRGWGKRPVKVAVHDPDSVDPGLLLFATFVVRGLAEDAHAAAGAASAAAAAGS